MNRSWVCVAVALVGIGVGAEALACSIANGFRPFMFDPTSADTVSPGPVSISSFSVRRGVGPEEELGGCAGQSSTSCDDLGFLDIRYEPATDDQTAPEEIGYVFELVEGTLPEGLALPVEPISNSAVGTFSFGWIDGATDKQEPFNFTLRITAVDKAGNMGPTSEPFVISDAGTEAGCQTAPGRAGGAAVWALLLLLVWGWPRPGRAKVGLRNAGV